MKPFLVKVLELQKVYDMPGSWQDADYRDLLQALEIDDVDDLSSGDLIDVLLMGLQDLEPEAAADLVLAHKLQTSVSPGSRRNIIEDFLEDQRPWEEAADIGLHAGIFAAGVLLNKAFPKTFARPDMMKLTLRLQARKPEARQILQAPPEAAFVARLLADAMDEHSILERLFDEQLLSHSFPEAEGIIWHAQFNDKSERDEDSAVLTVYSSEHWLDAMDAVSEFESSAFNDRAADADDD